MKGRDLCKRLLVLTLATIVGLVTTEGLVRLRQWFNYGSLRNTLYSTYVEPASGLRVPAPSQRTASIEIDSRGFRNPELAVPKPAGRIRLAFLGSSTTFCAEASSNETTWPHLLWRNLQDAWPDLSFDYVNAAVPGYTLASSLKNLNYRVKALQPDVIFIYDAVNDLSRDTRELAIAQGIISKPHESPAPGWSLTWYLLEKNVEIMARQRRGFDATSKLAFDPRSLAAGFHERLRELVESSQKVASVVVLVTFSQRLRRNQSNEEKRHACETHLYYMPQLTVDGILSGLEEYNRVIREVARETSVVLVEGEDTIPADRQHFADSVHFTDRGCELMARRVFTNLVRSTALRAFLSARRASVPGRSPSPPAASM